MKQLKTLKDIDLHEEAIIGNLCDGAIDGDIEEDVKEALKQEAIKWVKIWQESWYTMDHPHGGPEIKPFLYDVEGDLDAGCTHVNIADWIKHFFNITEEELKTFKQNG